MGTQIITTERLILRKIVPSDAEAMFKYMSDPDVLKYEGWEPHKTVEKTRGYILWITGDYKSKETYRWGIELNGELIGDILGGRVLAYYIRKNYWSKGYATEATRAVINYMLSVVGFDRVEAKHAVKNVASGNVLKKAGMRFRGHVKEMDYCDGEWLDCDFYFLTRDQYSKSGGSKSGR